MTVVLQEMEKRNWKSSVTKVFVLHIKCYDVI